jgi:hypothetical protein
MTDRPLTPEDEAELSKLPYGLWRRDPRVTRKMLDEVERRSRDQDESWELRYPEEADRLDALKGKVVALKKAREGIPDPQTGEGRSYPKGARFTVQGRVRGWLLVSTADLPCPLMMKPEWVTT